MTGNTASALGDDIESVTLFTKFDNGFYSASSDGQDRSKAVATYHLSSRGGLKWLFDVSLFPQKARYTFAKYGDVRTAALTSGGREGGVVGVRFSLRNRQILDVHRFARLFADAFDASCEKAPAFPFKRADGVTYPATSSFANVDFDLLHHWIAECLTAPAVKFVELPATSHNGDIHEVQSTADPALSGTTLGKHSGVRVAHRENVAPAPDKPWLYWPQRTPPLVTPDPYPIRVPVPTVPHNTVNSAGLEPTKGWYFGRNAWVPGAIIATIVGGAVFAMSLLQQSEMRTQLSSLNTAMSALDGRLADLDTRLKPKPAPYLPPDPSKTPAGSGTPEKKPDGSPGSQVGGAAQIDEATRKAEEKRQSEERREKEKIEAARRTAEKAEKAAAAKLAKDKTVAVPAPAGTASGMQRRASGAVSALPKAAASGAGAAANPSVAPVTTVITDTQVPAAPPPKVDLQPGPAGAPPSTVPKEMIGG